MTARFVRDIIVSTGTYEQDGQTKHRYMKIGALFKGDDGNTFGIIDPWVNLAGLPRRDGGGILLNFWEPRDNNNTQSQPRQQTQSRGAPARQPQNNAPDDADIPF